MLRNNLFFNNKIFKMIPLRNVNNKKPAIIPFCLQGVIANFDSVTLLLFCIYMFKVLYNS